MITQQSQKGDPRRSGPLHDLDGGIGPHHQIDVAKLRARQRLNAQSQFQLWKYVFNECLGRVATLI